MTQDTQISPQVAANDTAMQNWQAMVPGLHSEMAALALTSADTILYQWDAENGSMTFSENIDRMLPERAPLPRHIDDWQQMIDTRDQESWESHREIWCRQEGTYELRYRMRLEEKPVWVKHCALTQPNSPIVVGAVTFNCTPPESKAPHMSAIKPYVTLPSSQDGQSLNTGEFICRLQLFQQQNKSKGGSVIICAITSFNIIAQALGQSAAESVIQEVELKLKQLLPEETDIFRIHNDQFGLILQNTNREITKNTIYQIEDCIRRHGMESEVGAVHTSSVCGYTHFSAEDQNAALIIDRVFNDLNRHPLMLQTALTQDPEDSVMARQQMGLANYLSKALDENKLRLAYQPIIDAKSGEIAHYEALLRLIDDKGRINSAGALIPIAERMGLINMVDHKVLEMVVHELETYPEVKLAFNVSNLTTENPEWLAQMQQLLGDRPEIAARLTVEITETAAQRDLRRTAYFVAMVQDLGCQVALDDFGSGYTSFRQLKTLSVDCVKIDGSFIRDLSDNADNRFFVKTLLEFTELFGLKSVAEYVETGESAKLLMELGVDYLQGYYFSRPENHRSWLKDGEYGAS
jgi:EAL domain-containing protein (putative c-di-GMP-specific phosphodiesterase class I)